MKNKIYILLLISILMFQFCDNNPVNSETNTNIIFIFQYSDNSKSGLTDINSEEEQSVLCKTKNTQEFDKIKIVFYSLGISYETLYQSYENNSSRLYSYTSNFEGNQLDFNDYWVKKDKGEMDILTNGKYSVEKRSTLSISDGKAHGEFELSEGMKACRVGLFEDDVLTWVGKSSGFVGGFFDLHTHHEDGYESEPTYIYINLQQVTPAGP